MKETSRPFIVIKGPVYAIDGEQTFFSYTTDLDIFPLGDNRLFAQKLLESGRFFPEIDPRQENYFCLEQAPWIDTHNGLILDIHNEIFAPFLGQIGEKLDKALGEHVRQVQFQDIALLTLSPALNALFLMLHGEKHFWRFKKDRLSYLTFRSRLSTMEENEFMHLVSRFKLDTLYAVSEGFLKDSPAHDSFAVRYCIRYLSDYKAKGYPDSFLQVWRPRNIAYRFLMAPSWDAFLVRWINHFIPVMPPAAYRHKSYSKWRLRLVHFLRMLGLHPSYPPNKEWFRWLRHFDYPLPSYTSLKKDSFAN